MRRRAAFCIGALTTAAVALSPAGLQAAISAAISTKQPTFVIPPGVYNFSDAGIGGLNISRATNLVIDGSGSDLVFFPGFGVTVTSSANLTLRNLTLDYVPACFTQGVVTVVNTSASTLDIVIDQGFPACSATSPIPAPYFDAGEIKVIFFDPTTRAHIRGQSGANLATFVTPSVDGTCESCGALLRRHCCAFAIRRPHPCRPHVHPWLLRLHPAGWLACVRVAAHLLDAVQDPRLLPRVHVDDPGLGRGPHAGRDSAGRGQLRVHGWVITQDVMVLGGGNFAFTGARQLDRGLASFRLPPLLTEWRGSTPVSLLPSPRQSGAARAATRTNG